MTYLSNLFRDIEHFYSMAEGYDLLAYAAAEDDRIHGEMTAAAKLIASEAGRKDVSQQILMLAAMFRRAVEIGAGFNTVYLASKGILEDLDVELDDEDPGKNEITTAIHALLGNIRSRAMERDSASIQRELQRAASDVLRQLEESGEDIERPDEAQENLMEMGQSSEAAGVGGGDSSGEVTPEESTEANEVVQAFEDEGGSKMDPTAGLTPEMRGKGPGAGVRLFEKRPLKDWAATYQAEQNKYKMDLNGPNNLVTPAVASARRKSKTRYYLFTLDKTLERLIELTKRASEIEQKIQLETEVEHPQEEAEYNEILPKLRGLEKLRLSLKKSLNYLYKEARLNDLKERFDITKDDRQKIMLAKRIERAQTSIEKVQKDKDTFESSKQALYRERALQLAKGRKIKGPGEEPARIPTRKERLQAPVTGKAIKRHEYDWANMELANYTQKLQEALLAKRKTFKDAVIRMLKRKGAEEIKPYIDDVATAANKGVNIGMAAQRLSQQIRLKDNLLRAQQQEILPRGELMSYLFSIRASKALYNFRDRLKTINDVWLGPEVDLSTLTPEQQEGAKAQLADIRKTVDMGKDLIGRFASYQAKLPFTGGPQTKHPEYKEKTFPTSFGPTNISGWGGAQFKAKGDTVTEIVQKIVDYLEPRLQNLGV